MIYLSININTYNYKHKKNTGHNKNSKICMQKVGIFMIDV